MFDELGKGYPGLVIASGGPVAQRRNVIDAAKKVGRMVQDGYVFSPAKKFSPILDYLGTEDMLRASGMPWTASGLGFHLESGLALIGDPAGTGVIDG